MLRILSHEGLTVTERELSRIRKQNGYALRTAHGMKTRSTAPSQTSTDDLSSFPMFDNSPEVTARRQIRQAELKAESDKRLKAKTRRVRTRKYGTLPADPPMPPRFPSEMTIGQSKGMLQLTQDLYNRMRTRFQIMCEAENITKKTECSHKWKLVKESLIEETLHLQMVIRINPTDEAGRKLQKDRLMALDIICCDVTKKIRTSKTRVTIPDAKTTLGVNPAQANEIRKLFYEILIQNHFTSKMEAGQEQWDNMKEELKSQSQILQDILNPGIEDPQHAAKLKSLEVICRDVMKRLRDDQTKMEKSRRSASAHSMNASQTPQNEVLPEIALSSDIDSFPITNTHVMGYGQMGSDDSSALTSQPLGDTQPPNYGLPIDPTLLGIHPQYPYHESSTQHPLLMNNHESFIQQPQAADDQFDMIIYNFCLSTESPMQEEPLNWFSGISGPPTVASIREFGLEKHVHLGVQVLKIWGRTPTIPLVATNRDEDLEAFLHRAGGEHITFELFMDYPY